ncbi:hypothetical protein FA13DRAFT_1291991 [Coprinellus micaceus]|uniref:Uncharacterized protein n=1 Tax=Coprinellus micaceus TaxID=71717 RepID=A0A4Y7SS65_COPMI|nr:hypothetical protein FA13DRAFT_1291991 [Coprinellus micaceus]
MTRKLNRGFVPTRLKTYFAGRIIPDTPLSAVQRPHRLFKERTEEERRGTGLKIGGERIQRNEARRTRRQGPWATEKHPPADTRRRNTKERRNGNDRENENAPSRSDHRKSHIQLSCGTLCFLSITRIYQGTSASFTALGNCGKTETGVTTQEREGRGGAQKPRERHQT